VRFNGLRVGDPSTLSFPLCRFPFIALDVAVSWRFTFFFSFSDKVSLSFSYACFVCRMVESERFPIREVFSYQPVRGVDAGAGASGGVFLASLPGFWALDYWGLWEVRVVGGVTSLRACDYIVVRAIDLIVWRRTGDFLPFGEFMK